MADNEADESGVPLFEELSDSDSPAQGTPAKRKREADLKSDNKKAKRRKLKKPKDVGDEALDLDLGVNHAIAHMDSRLVADHIAQRTKRFQPKSSLLELEDDHIPEKAITDTSSWDKPRTSEYLAAFLEHFSSARQPRTKKTPGRKLSEAPMENGHPHTIVVAGAGLRAADLTRALRKFQTKEALVAKLFAKHIKLKEAQEMVKKSRMNIGVGTPQRLMDLLEDGPLSSSCLERIVIDASHIDQKKRGILDMKETQIPLVRFLLLKSLKDRYGDCDRKIELLFF